MKVLNVSVSLSGWKKYYYDESSDAEQAGQGILAAWLNENSSRQVPVNGQMVQPGKQC